MIDISKAQAIVGWMEDHELVQLAEWAQKYPNIVEVGSWKGRSTRALCDNNGNGIVVACDHWRGPEDIEMWKHDYVEILDSPEPVLNIFKANLKDHLKSKKLSIVKLDSQKAAMKVLKLYGEGYFDMVFIDADHTYEHGRDDIQSYKHLIKPGGIIAGHDFTYPGIAKAVVEFLPNYKLAAGSLWYSEV